MTVECEIAIVGSGPSGAAAAWTISKLAPELIPHTIIIEAGRHPKEKVCAGCVTGRSWKLLEGMGLSVHVNHVTIDAVRFLTMLGDINLPRTGVARIVRRGEFDAALLDRVRSSGIAVHENARVSGATRDHDHVHLAVARKAPHRSGYEEKYIARAVIGADGATSAIRRRMAQTLRPPIRTMMAEVPAPSNYMGLPENLIVFDFRLTGRGFRGYRWIFPCLREADTRWFSVGICDFDPSSRWDLRPEVEHLLHEYGLSPTHVQWREYPFLAFDMRDRLGGPGWLLAGEAAGSDQLLAEGISYAIESGVLAAEHIVEAFRSNDFSMRNYTHRYHWSRVGKELRTLKALAGMFYNPLLHKRVLRAGLFNDQLCAIGGEILAGELEPRSKLALRIALNLFRTMGSQILTPLRK